MSSPGEIVPSIEMSEGWHCSHLYYRFDRNALRGLSADELAAGKSHFVEALDPAGPEAPTRLQTSILSGHKGDFGLMILDPNPLRVDGVHQRIMSGPLAAALVPTWSFVSVTEISEYVPSVEAYTRRLIAEGEKEGSPALEAKARAYGQRLEGMNRQRLTPDLPDWPATCFYPMNKKREVGENWFLLAKEDRNRLMGEHARSGIAFAGRVTQLITVGLGYDDWEWGVTLWAANPAFLKEIVYKMRFDEASARYAQFGPFYVSYVATPQEILDHCRV